MDTVDILGGGWIAGTVDLGGEKSDIRSDKKAGPGRQQAIDDGRLELTRNYLVWLLESTWGDAGSKLRSIKSAADVRSALSAWEQCGHREYVVDILVRASETPATPKKLRAIRRRLDQLSESIYAAQQFQEQCRESLERAERALAGQWSDNEKVVIQEKRDERKSAFDRAGAECRSLNDRHKELLESLRDSEAYFARTEVARFCKSRRYRLTPLHAANALAGLPFIGWRQSAKRCGRLRYPHADGYTYQTFKIFRRIVDSRPRRGELVEHMEQWLRSHPESESHAIAELRKNWYYLRRAVQQVLKTKQLSRELPYAILREYLKRKSQPSAADLLFEEEERITA